MVKMGDKAVELRQFIQELQDKISIAAAIAVIRTKPHNVPIQGYVQEIQNKVLKEWQKNPKPDVFEDKLLSIHLIKSAQDIAEVLPNSPAVNSDDSPIDPAYSKFVLENLSESRSNSTIPDEAVVEEHGVYFQSLVQLKFTVETRKTVPFDSVRDFIGVTKRQGGSDKSNLLGQFGSPRKSSVSQDSGVVSSAPNACKVPNSVSSSLFKSITHSADTEALILKSSQSLLKYVRFAIFNTPFDSFYRWKGSLLEKTCKILACSSVDIQCRSVICSFIASSLDQIWMIEDDIKVEIESFAVEHQLMILSTLCEAADVCSSALNNIMIKFDEFTTRFAVNEPPSSSEVYKVEKVPHFLRFAEILFANWMRRIRIRLDESEGTKINSSSLATTWRLKRGETEGSLLDKAQVLLKCWRETLERLSVSCVEVYPLVNSYLLKTLTAIDSLAGTMEPQEEYNVFFDTVCDQT